MLLLVVASALHPTFLGASLTDQSRPAGKHSPPGPAWHVRYQGGLQAGPVGHALEGNPMWVSHYHAVCVCFGHKTFFILALMELKKGTPLFLGRGLY